MARDERNKSTPKDGGKDEDYEFIPPDFDEDAFIHREMVSFRTTTILFVWGILAAAVSYFVFRAVDGAKVGWLTGLAIAAVFGYALKWLYPRFKADVKHFGRREWLGTGFLFFFTWLAFFLIAINPPLSDFAPPRVDLHAAPPVQQAGDTVNVYAFFEDNDRVASHEFQVLGPNGPVAAMDEDLGHGHHRIIADGLAAGIYTVAASATDAHGLKDNATIQFAVVEQVMSVDLPTDGKIDQAGDQVLVTFEGVKSCSTKKPKVLTSCVRTVVLDFADSDAIVTLRNDPAVGAWIASPNHVGWPSGNVTFDVVAQIIDTYAGSAPVEGGTLTSGPYGLDVSTAPGEFVVKVIKDPGAPTRRVPDLGLPLLAIGLLAVVAIARRR